MYVSKFGLNYNPFLKNNDNVELNTLDHSQALFRLKQLEMTKGIGLIVGEPGLGKTTTIRHWTSKLSRDEYKVIYIHHATLVVNEFYRELAYKLNLEPQYSKRKNLIAIQREMDRLRIEKRITPVVIIDEANNLQSSVLTDLKIIFNFNMDSKDPYILLLVGQNSLVDKLRRSANEPLKQRITMKYQYGSLDKDGCKMYVDSKLAEAGLSCELFLEEAYETLYTESQGIPRNINQIMINVFILMENQQLNAINSKLITMAANEIYI